MYALFCKCWNKQDRNVIEGFGEVIESFDLAGESVIEDGSKCHTADDYDHQDISEFD